MKPGLLAMTALLVGGLLVERALSQAAVETVITHGLASSAGSSLGRTLGNALGNATGQVGNRLGQQTSTVPPRPRVAPVKTARSTSATPAALTAPAPSSSGSLIASIQGGVPPTGSASTNCTAAPKTDTAPPAKSDASSSPSSEKPLPFSGNCAPSADTNSHPSVINLPPAN